jgi:hypothetical protein
MAPSRTELIDRYAELVVRVGVNIQPGQVVAIRCLVEHVELARAVTEHAYRAGASRVLVEYLDNHVRRSMVVHAPAETLSTSLPFQSQVFGGWLVLEELDFVSAVPDFGTSATPTPPSSSSPAVLNRTSSAVSTPVG